MVQYLSDEAFSELMLEQEVSSSSSITTVLLRTVWPAHIRVAGRTLTLSHQCVCSRALAGQRSLAVCSQFRPMFVRLADCH